MDGTVHGFEQALFVLEIIGVVAFAIAGALRAIEREMDLFGMAVLAATTALGGGIIRDLLAQRFPVSLSHPVYFIFALVGALLAVPAISFIARHPSWFKAFDALGLAVFSVLGANVALAQGLNLISVLLFGVLTGIGGGVVRDILADDVPMVLRQEIYGLASLVGITVQWALVHLHVALIPAAVAGATVIFLVRLAAIRWNWNLPRVRMR
jgi:uncharacterized membrane protein YeiH